MASLKSLAFPGTTPNWQAQTNAFQLPMPGASPTGPGRTPGSGAGSGGGIWGGTIKPPMVTDTFNETSTPDPLSGGTRMPPIVSPFTPTDRAASGAGSYAPAYQPLGAPGANGGATANGGVAGFGGMPPPSPTAGGSQTIATNPIGSQGQANYGPNAGPDWRKGYTGNAADLQGAQGKVNIGMWNAQQQNARDAAARQVSADRNARLAGMGSNDLGGDGSTLHGQAKVNAILAQGNQQSQDDPAQQEVWANSLDPTRIEGKPLETWSPQQLQSGLSFYQQQLAQAVPGSNEWNMYNDRLNSIKQNLAGNRSPWSYPTQSGPGYFNNNAGTPAGGWNLGGGPRS